VVEKIRKEDNKTPVLFLTAISEFDYRKQAIKNGADAYMSKPFMIRDLLDKVKELTSKGTEQQ
jgi:two-component system OmpR family response regulator